MLEKEEERVERSVIAVGNNANKKKNRELEYFLFFFPKGMRKNCSSLLKVFAQLSTSWFVPYDMMISGVHTYVRYSSRGQNIDT